MKDSPCSEDWAMLICEPRSVKNTRKVLKKMLLRKKVEVFNICDNLSGLSLENEGEIANFNIAKISRCRYNQIKLR